MQSPLSVYPPKCDGTQYECPLLHNYMEINSELQLTISPMLLSPMLLPLSNSSGGMVTLTSRIRSIIWWYLPYLNSSLKNLCSRRTVAFSESPFQYVAASLRLPRSHQTPPPPPTPSPPTQAWSLQLFSALIWKYVLQDGIESDDDCFQDNEGNESDIYIFVNDSDSGDSEDEVYTWSPYTWQHRILKSLHDMTTINK